MPSQIDTIPNEFVTLATYRTLEERIFRSNDFSLICVAAAVVVVVADEMSQFQSFATSNVRLVRRYNNVDEWHT